MTFNSNQIMDLGTIVIGGKIVKEHGKDSFYCILNCVKDVIYHKMRGY